MEEIECKRCGECCSYIDSKGKKHYCKNLIKEGDITTCKIYENRDGFRVYKNLVCTDRMDHKVIHPGCPYNVAIASSVGLI